MELWEWRLTGKRLVAAARAAAEFARLIEIDQGNAMPPATLKDKILRLQREIEKLAAKHEERLPPVAVVSSSKLRELETKRAKILARRRRQLDEMLGELQKGDQKPPRSGGRK